MNVLITDSSTADEPAVTITTRGEPPEFGAQLLADIQRGVRVRIVHDGSQRFDGTPEELAELGYDEAGLAGEHPIERSIRLLTNGSTG